ncbi:MAG: VacB/RNase II family 3'-5' exoribonuclease, partial [Cellvibrionaceae bacterium]|nr:VacB/RNase II family 3'-5' exoribonuclease [Cellvibrionaceae bacterium]
MLKNDALAQLNQLKKDIRAAKDIAKGTVRGSSGKFGFAVLDDGREAFISPLDMNRVFPGDRVRINIVEGKGGKPQAELEKLLESPLRDFVGKYVVKGQGHFVEPDLPQFNRWLFIPPKQRKGLKAGDYLHCRVTQHPFYKDGKAQVKVLGNLGQLQQAGFEARYMAAKFELPEQFKPKALAEQSELAEGKQQALWQQRPLAEAPFVTIDGANTLDMDDAIAVAQTDNGYRLSVAIADPGAEIAAGSELAESALGRSQTVYMPGHSLHMLPTELSHQRFSLVAEQERPCILVELDIDTDGAISHSQFSLAKLQSQRKLSYQQVADFLAGDDSEALPAAIADSLKHMQALAERREQYRREHALVMEDKPDFELELGENGKINAIHKLEKNPAHKMVEEAMLAANIAAAEFFAAKRSKALYSTHSGIKADKLDNLRGVLGEDHPALAELALDSLAGYRELMQKLETLDGQLYFTIKRLLQSSELRLEPAPHLGLGLNAYATITSPIRRYQDLYNHYQLKQALGQGQGSTLNEEQLQALQQQLQRGRQAVRQMEQWLHCQYMNRQTGSEHSATIALVNGQGVGVRFDDSGIEGFALLQNKEQPWQLDHRRLKLVRDDTVYQLGQAVTVKVVSVD